MNYNGSDKNGLSHLPSRNGLIAPQPPRSRLPLTIPRLRPIPPLRTTVRYLRTTPCFKHSSRVESNSKRARLNRWP